MASRRRRNTKRRGSRKQQRRRKSSQQAGKSTVSPIGNRGTERWLQSTKAIQRQGGMTSAEAPMSTQGRTTGEAQQADAGQGGMTSEEAASVQAPFRPSFKLPVPEAPITMAPIDVGIVRAVPTFKLSGAATATKEEAVSGPTVTANLKNYKAEIGKEFSTACGDIGFEYSDGQLTGKFMAKDFPMEMSVSGTTLAFISEPTEFSHTSDGWTYTGKLGMALEIEIIGRPQVVEAVLVVAASGYAAAAYGSQAMAAIEAAVAAVIRTIPPMLETATTRMMPLIIIITPQMRELEGPRPGGDIA